MNPRDIENPIAEWDFRHQLNHKIMEEKENEILKRNLIAEHLEGFTRVNAASIQQYAISGKISGSLFTELKCMMGKYAEKRKAEEQDMDLIDFNNFVFNHPKKHLKMGAYVNQFRKLKTAGIIFPLHPSVYATL